jgi:hypothetical protein
LSAALFGVRWPFLILVLGCGAPPQASTPSATPTFEPTRPAAVTLAGRTVVCDATSIEIPQPLATTKSSDAMIVAASADAVLEVAARESPFTVGEIRDTWIALHEQIAGPLPSDFAFTAQGKTQGVALVTSYATDRGPPQFRFAYRHDDRCTIFAVERISSTSGVIARVARTDD